MKTPPAFASRNCPDLNLNRILNLSVVPVRIKIKRKIMIKMAAAVSAMLALITFPIFAAEVSLASAPPVVVKTVPAAGAMDVDPGLLEIKVTYSKAMQDGSWSWCWWENKDDYPETTSEPKYLQDGRTCVLPVKLQPNKFYALWLNTEKFKNFKDTSSRPAVPYLLTFFTGDSAGQTPGSSFSTNPITTRKFVRLVVGKDEMTFEGEPITPGQLDSRLAEVPDRAHAVLELAVASDTVTVKQVEDAKGLASQLAMKHKFNHLSLVGFHPLGTKGGPKPKAATRPTSNANDALLNDDQRAVLEWTDRQFRSFFDERTFDGWSEQERATLERKLIDSLKGPHSREYYQAINTLVALRSTKALPALREIAYDRREKDNRDRWMAIRALGMLGEQSDVPELIPLVYHGNSNTRWWAQISLVRLTGQNFAKDWNGWGKWWNDQNGQPSYKPELIRWWSGQAEPDKLVETLTASDRNFIAGLKPKTAAAESVSATPVSATADSVKERTVNKLVSDFPEARDLSSPESACAAWQRANVHKDAQGISQMSLVSIPPKETEDWLRREEARDAEGLAIYLKALAESKIISVQTWRGDLANVVTWLPFPEGKGRHPYSARVFGRVKGEWKNLGEDRLPTAEAARQNFEQKKETLWNKYNEYR